MALSDNMRGAALMTFAMAAFTLNDACMKSVTVTLPLYQAIFLRGCLTIIALSVMAHFMGGFDLRLPRRDAGIVAWRTLGEVVGTITFLSALTHMEFANLSAIMQSLPLGVTLAAALLFSEPVGWRRMLAIAIGFIGVLIIIRPGGDGFSIWSLVGLGSVLSVVLRDLATRSLSPTVRSVTVAIYAAIGVTLMGAVLTPFQGWVTPDAGEILKIVAAASFLIFGYLTVVMVMRVGEIGFVAPFRYTSLIFAIFLGWLVFDQFPDGWTLTGSAIVVATGIFTLYRESRLRQTAR